MKIFLFRFIGAGNEVSELSIVGLQIRAACWGNFHLLVNKLFNTSITYSLLKDSQTVHRGTAFKEK